MLKGKNTCRILKEIRRQIAEANDIEYVVEECRYKGDCLGTCPKCEAELHYLEQQLHQRQMLGKAVVLTGLSASLLTLGSCEDMTDKLSAADMGLNAPAKTEAIFGDIPEQMPCFPGSMSALMKYLQENVVYPEQVKEECVQGRVICTFIVMEDGSLADVKVVKSVHPLLDAEAIRVIKAMPRWIPGRENGKTAKVKFTLPISFRMKDTPADSVKTEK